MKRDSNKMSNVFFKSTSCEGTFSEEGKRAGALRDLPGLKKEKTFEDEYLSSSLL